jgi:hypothetical protein
LLLSFYSIATVAAKWQIRTLLLSLCPFFAQAVFDLYLYLWGSTTRNMNFPDINNTELSLILYSSGFKEDQLTRHRCVLPGHLRVVVDNCTQDFQGDMFKYSRSSVLTTVL